MIVDAQSAFAVLADGMGGHNAGEVASSMAAELVSADIRKWREESPVLDAGRVESLIAKYVADANAAVFQAAQKHASYGGMGTTIVVVLWHGENLTVGHVGDSRFYRLRHGELEQLTRDHSLVQEQLDRGAITPALARHAANRNVLTRAVGIDPQVNVDVRTHSVERDDLYLLCSDGLSEMLTDAQIRETLISSQSDIDSGAQWLVQQANANGGLDNISVAIARVVNSAPESGE